MNKLTTIFIINDSYSLHFMCCFVVTCHSPLFMTWHSYYLSFMLNFSAAHHFLMLTGSYYLLFHVSFCHHVLLGSYFMLEIVLHIIALDISCVHGASLWPQSKHLGHLSSRVATHVHRTARYLRDVSLYFPANIGSSPHA